MMILDVVKSELQKKNNNIECNRKNLARHACMVRLTRSDVMKPTKIVEPFSL